MGSFFFAPLLCPRPAFEPSALIEAPPNPGTFEPPLAPRAPAAAATAGIAAAASNPPPVADKNFRRSMFDSLRSLSFKVASAALPHGFVGTAALYTRDLREGNFPFNFFE